MSGRDADLCGAAVIAKLVIAKLVIANARAEWARQAML